MAHLALRPDLSAPRDRRPRWWERLLRIVLLGASMVLIMFSLVAGIQRAHADSVTYLIEVTVRPDTTSPTQAPG